jgi:predicted fused transcriptional regulator/phosphomethylpyrimidine kinase
MLALGVPLYYGTQEAVRQADVVAVAGRISSKTRKDGDKTGF